MIIELRYNNLNGDFVRFGEGRGRFNGIIAVFPVVNGAHKKTLDGGKDREGDLMKKIIVLVLVAVLLTCGLVLVSCKDSCPGGGGCKLTDGCWADTKLKGDDLTKAAQCSLDIIADKKCSC